MHADSVDIRTRGKTGDSSQHFYRVMDDRTRFRSRHQRAIGTIRAISESFPGRLEPGGPSCRDELGARQAEQNQRSVCRSDSSRDCIGDPAIADGDVVQSTVGLDVHQANALAGGNGRERLNLANDQICYLV